MAEESKFHFLLTDIPLSGVLGIGETLMPSRDAMQNIPPGQTLQGQLKREDQLYPPSTTHNNKAPSFCSVAFVPTYRPFYCPS